MRLPLMDHRAILESRGWELVEERPTHGLQPMRFWTHKDHPAPKKDRLRPGAWTTASAMEIEMGRRAS